MEKLAVPCLNRWSIVFLWYIYSLRSPMNNSVGIVLDNLCSSERQPFAISNGNNSCCRYMFGVCVPCTNKVHKCCLTISIEWYLHLLFDLALMLLKWESLWVQLFTLGTCWLHRFRLILRQAYVLKWVALSQGKSYSKHCYSAIILVWFRFHIPNVTGLVCFHVQILNDVAVFLAYSSIGMRLQEQYIWRRCNQVKQEGLLRF